MGSTTVPYTTRIRTLSSINGKVGTNRLWSQPHLLERSLQVLSRLFPLMFPRKFCFLLILDAHCIGLSGMSPTGVESHAPYKSCSSLHRAARNTRQPRCHPSILHFHSSPTPHSDRMLYPQASPIIRHRHTHKMSLIRKHHIQHHHHQTIQHLHNLTSQVPLIRERYSQHMKFLYSHSHTIRILRSSSTAHLRTLIIIRTLRHHTTPHHIRHPPRGLLRHFLYMFERLLEVTRSPAI